MELPREPSWTRSPRIATTITKAKLLTVSFHVQTSKVWAQSRQLAYGLRHKLGHVLRAVGLRSINHLSPHRHGPEKAKVILDKSFSIALSRSAVHLAPISVFILVFIANCTSVYIGPGLTVGNRYDSLYLILFQIGAKLQELLCLASLSTILLQVVRFDLIQGNGMPLGLISAHLWLSQPASLISPEYLAAVQQNVKGLCNLPAEIGRIKHGRYDKICQSLVRVRLLSIILVFVVLGTFVGPFTAVLLIPRSQTFPAGGSWFPLNATAEEMWPSVIRPNLEFEACFWQNATEYAVCPSGGYASFQAQRNYNKLYDTTNSYPSRQADYNLEDYDTLMLDPLGVAPAVFSIGSIAVNGDVLATCATQPNLYGVILLQSILRDWKSATYTEAARYRPFASFAEYKFAGAPTATASTTFPFSMIRCTQPQNLSEHAEDAQFRYIQHPTSLPRGWSNGTTNKTASILSLRRTPISHVRTQWLPLSSEEFGPVSIGLLFELPWSQPSNSRLAIACTIAASWVTADIYRTKGTDHFGWYVLITSVPYNQTIRMGLGPNDPEAQSSFRHIQLTPEWLDLLTPEAPDPPPTEDAWRPTTLENIFYKAGFDTLIQNLRQYPRYIGVNGVCGIGMLDPTLSDAELFTADVCSEYAHTDYIEWIIASLVSDGLSRRLSYRAFDILPELRAWVVSGLLRNEDYDARLMQGDPNKNAVLLDPDSSAILQHVDITIDGLGYRISTTAELLAMVIAGIYCLAALAHVVWTLTYRTTSSSWDTATELMLLAFNSPPSVALRGTSAQVHRWNTYNHVVTVRAERQESEVPDTKPQMYVHLLVDAVAETPEAREEDATSKHGPQGQTNLPGLVGGSGSSIFHDSGLSLQKSDAKVYEVVQAEQKYW